MSTSVAGSVSKRIWKKWAQRHELRDMVEPFLNMKERYSETEYEALYSGAGPDDYNQYIESKMTHNE